MLIFASIQHRIKGNDICQCIWMHIEQKCLGVMYTNTIFSIDIQVQHVVLSICNTCNEQMWVRAGWQNTNKYEFVYWNGNFIKYWYNRCTLKIFKTYEYEYEYDSVCIVSNRLCDLATTISTSIHVTLGVHRSGQPENIWLNNKLR